MNNHLELKDIIKNIDKVAPGVVHLVIEHEENCPALRTHRLEDCTCKPNIQKMDGEA